METTVETVPAAGGTFVSSVELASRNLDGILRLHRSRSLEGVSFWTLDGTARSWSHAEQAYGLWFVAGSQAVRWSARGGARTIQPGSVIFAQPGEAHRLAPAAERASLFVVWWDPAAFDDCVARSGRAPVLAPQAPLPNLADRFAPLQSLREEIHGRGDARHVERCLLAATARVIDAATIAVPLATAGMHPAVKRTLELLNTRFSQALSLDALAEQARLSKFHFARLFRDTTGFAPHQYQTLLRLAAARRALESGLSVEDAACQTGFSDGPHLARTFRERYGVSPGAWARAHRTLLGAPRSSPRRRSTPPPPPSERPVRESGFCPKE